MTQRGFNPARAKEGISNTCRNRKVGLRENLEGLNYFILDTASLNPLGSWQGFSWIVFAQEIFKSFKNIVFWFHVTKSYNILFISFFLGIGPRDSCMLSTFSLAELYNPSSNVYDILMSRINLGYN